MCGCAALVAGGRLPPPALPRRGSSVRAEVSPGGESQQKKVAVAGAGWAGLAAAHHLVKQVEFPIFHNQPRLPAPFGVFAYPEFPNLPLIDRLTSIPVMTAVIDFDNTDTAWRKYDASSYKYTLRGSTSFPNLFIAGDWIVNRHGSFSKEKAYVTGLEAANRVVDYFDTGDFAKIIAVEGDEPHIETLRSLNRRLNELKSQIPFSEFFLQ
ncbi:unnamed protein product [Miscanthus lutarioriparius]|uniref:FAD/NAD(P)-binding domain-containing protein n=1 Tax=Miscanthus lutarioriparius TaxID=422564 RepID=A0A811NCQ8_9POAL|nr:unnamed protein product [Miscanthus lutarioriparius]